MKQFENSVQHWLSQRFSAIMLLILFPWFIYCFSYPFYFNNLFSFDEKLLLAISNPLELLFFVILIFFIFWHAIMGIHVICEDYIHNVSIRVLTITCIKYLSGITYVVLTFTIFFFYRHILL